MKRVIPVLIVSCLLVSCVSNKRTDDKVVFVSILPLKYFADKIAGDKYKIEVTVPPGAGPETYSPTPRQMMLLSRADAYFSIGYLAFEDAWLGNLASNPELKIFKTSDGIDLIKNEEEEHDDHAHPEGVDPHIWSSPKEARIIAENIFKGFTVVDSENKEYYSKNLQKLLSEIDSVDTIVTKILSNSPVKKFLIFHPALGYLARAYGLEQLSIEFEGKVPSPRHMQNIIEEAKAGGINVVLIQKEFDKRNAEIIAKEAGCSIVQIDPLDYNWPDQIVSIATSLAGIGTREAQ